MENWRYDQGAEIASYLNQYKDNVHEQLICKNYRIRDLKKKTVLSNWPIVVEKKSRNLYLMKHVQQIWASEAGKKYDLKKAINFSAIGYGTIKKIIMITNILSPFKKTRSGQCPQEIMNVQLMK